ncbi:MAG: type VI secretion system baseplate subunit TssF [Deltaproteobacteria bacterium]|nr:type VI secretion system baseplate subunit TssF [Deltaproteobacteria bacterium]
MLSYYNRELQYVRETGQEFAKEFPKIAGRLGIESLECTDPYVERLLESFAFLTARVQLKIDAEFPRFTQHLLDMVYPHYLAPTPSMAVVQFKPSLTEGALADGFKVPRGSVLKSYVGRGEQTACEYRTAHDTTLWPIEIVGAEYTSFLGDLGNLPIPVKAKAALRLRLRATAGLLFNQLALDTLPVFLRGGDEIAMRLYELLLGHAVALVVRPAGQGGGAGELVLDTPVRPLGYEDEEALLPFGPRSFQGYRLLTEYFTLPSRFLFAQLGGLATAVRRCASPELEIIVVLDAQDGRLEKAIGPAQFDLFCSPAANLFPKRTDRIHLSESEYEYHVVPDRTRPMDYEIYQLTEVIGYGASGDEKQEFFPFYALRDQVSHEEMSAYYTVHRDPRMLSAKQRSQGARSSYVGSEVFLSLVDATEAPIRPHLKQIAMMALCTNRDLTLHIPIGQRQSDFQLESGAPVEAVLCVAGPTPPRPSVAHGDPSWRLINHLALNYLSITDDSNGGGASALRELLALYGDAAEPIVRKQIEGIRHVASSSITRRLPVPGPVSFGRGIEVVLTLDESAFEGASAFLLGSVLERFFAKYVSINSFCETVLKSVQRKEIFRWPAKLGRRPVI